MIAWVTVGFLVLTATGCARPDWIEQTLVTVDVTGVWRGSFSSFGTGTASGGGGPVELTLQQSGTKVTGQLSGSLNSVVGGRVPIEGTVNGDMFRFHDLRGGVTGAVQVSGDEMTGLGTARENSTTITLRRGR
jgi:hypothetical protein